MKIVDAITNSVDSNLLIVMAVSFVAVVWWGFRNRDGDSGGNDAGGGFWDGSDGDGDGGDGGD